MLDGEDLKTLNLQSLRRCIGLVGQEPALFATSIMENISLGRPGATLEECIEAAKAANAHGFISLLPYGYYTNVRMLYKTVSSAGVLINKTINANSN